MKTTHKQIFLVAVLVGSLAFTMTVARAADAKKPNIVFMLMDNLGYGELGCYGGGILRGAPTPRIDKLATEGMRLLNFNVEAQCTPSRSALMTGRFSIRSGTYEVPLGGVPDGLTLWEVTIAELLSSQGYATGMWGKWHLGSAEERFPTHQGFDEWYGIPRTYDEAMWPALNETSGMWPSVGNKQGWSAQEVPPEPIYEARKGEKARQIGTLDVEKRRTMEAEITSRAVEFIKRNASAGKPFYAYVSFSLVHFPTLPNREFAGKTGNGDWADCLAEMDYRTGQILDAIKEAGIEDNTLVVFTSDNGAGGDASLGRRQRAVAGHLFHGDGGRDSRAVHHPLAGQSAGGPHQQRDRPHRGLLHDPRARGRSGRAEGSPDRRRGPVGFLPRQTGKIQPRRIPRLRGRQAVRHQVAELEGHTIWQENMYDPPLRYPLPKVINLLTDMKEERDVGDYNSWVADPVMKIVTEFQASLKKYPPINVGTPDPYTPPN